MTVIGCRYDSHWLQIWQSLVADMTVIGCRYDSHWLQIWHISM